MFVQPAPCGFVCVCSCYKTGQTKLTSRQEKERARMRKRKRKRGRRVCLLVRMCGLKEVFRKRKSRSKWNERHSASVFVSGLRCLCRCHSRCCCCCCGMPHVATVASLDAAQAVNQICASLSFGVQVQIVQRKESQHTAHTQRTQTGWITTWANRQNSFFFAPNFLSLLILFVQITFC